VVVVAGGPAAAAAAAALGLDALVDPPDTASLDGALRAAVGRLGPRPELLVVAADLPRLTAADLTAVRAADAAVVVAPTVDGGTGVLVRRPATSSRPATAPAPGTPPDARPAQPASPAATVVRAGAAYDVDTVADLTALRDAPVGPGHPPAARRLGGLHVG
jgi:2-phospho-L-lactate/phosphoenolpyruvate guanylyltransferase